MYLLGASGHAKVIIDILRFNKIELNGFFDDNLSLKEFQGLSTLGLIEDSEKISIQFYCHKMHKNRN